MVPPCAWAWVTSAVDKQSVERAIILAASLRRVKTCGKLVVIASSKLAEAEPLRGSLYATFDLVCWMDFRFENGTSSFEAHAKVFAFSLGIFQRCVYVTPNCMVLRKCDEIFDFPSTTFVGLSTSQNNWDSSLLTFSPSIKHFQDLLEVLKGQLKANKMDANVDAFAKCVAEYAQNNNLEIDTVNKRYNQKLFHNREPFYGTLDKLVIVNYQSMDVRNMCPDGSSHYGLIETFVWDLWWNIYHETGHARTNPTSIHQPISTEECERDPIAIIGIGCRYPGANNAEEFWKLLVEGRDGIRQLPPHRWQKGHTITTASAKCSKTMGGFLNFPVDEFDAKFFGISPKEAEFLDPQQRLLHEITWEALEDAAIDPTSLRGSHTGVFIGSWIHDYKDMAVKTADRDFFRIYMGNSIAATAARLSFLFGTTGPSIATESGCSSAIVAVDLGCKSLRNRETNLALVGGVNLFLHPFSADTMSFVLAPDGKCKTFDAKADGFGRAEGVATLVLKRMSDAISDGDNIWGLIRGSAISQEGVSKSLGTPTVQSESLVMELALEDAGVEAKDVDFVETHGTATSLGDPLEIAAITKVYSKGRVEPLWIGSVKTNIGHTEACSGITGIIKVVLSLKNEMIPPHLNFDTLNPNINLEAIPARIPVQPVAWKRKLSGRPRLAGVSSFGISGTDGHVIIQEAPVVAGVNKVGIILPLERPLHLMKICAKSAEALDDLIVRYATALERNLDDEECPQAYANIAYTANIGRASFNHRAVIIAKDCQDGLKGLRNGAFKRKEIHGGGGEAKVCFLFTGQGSQYHGMAKQLYSTSPVFRMAFDKSTHFLKSKHNIQIQTVMWDETHDKSELINHTIYSQIAIFVVEFCLLALWESWGVKPHYVLGHSLGEFTAAVAAGVLNLEFALELVVQRSLLIGELPQGKMLVIKAELTAVEQMLTEFHEERDVPNFQRLDIAAINSQLQTVVAGDSEVVEGFFEFCSRKEVKSIILASTHAFHSKHMDPIIDKYRHVVESVFEQQKMSDNEVRGLKCGFVSGKDGTLIVDAETLKQPEYWVSHTRDKVNFDKATQVTFQEGCNIFLEIGPSPILSAFILTSSSMMNSSGTEVICLPSLRKNQEDWTTLLDTASKLFLADYSNVNFDWAGFDQYYPRKKASLPFYPFQRKKIWVDFRGTPGMLHPLVGRLVPNASKLTIFENDITLKQLGYLSDHAIGNTVIFPGAGFLEMCVVAGHSVAQGLTGEFSRPRRPVVLTGLKIKAPLAVHDGKACVLQTVVELNADDDAQENGGVDVGYRVKVYNWLAHDDDINANSTCEGGTWKSHATATFLPLVTVDEKLNWSAVNIAEIQEKWEKVSASKEFYDKLPEVGLRFGSSFQSLVCGWENEIDGILFEIKIPDEHEPYLIHPVVADAMLQATMVFNSRERISKKLHVPIQIQEFIWLSHGGSLSARYVYCTSAEGTSKQLLSLLLDESGNVLATMSGIEFIETTAKLVESMIQQQSNLKPQLWEEIWKPKPGPLHGRAEAARIDELSGDTSLPHEVFQVCGQLNELNDTELKVYRHLDSLTVLYFLKALYQLGWVPKLNEKIVVQEFIERHGIVDVASNYVRYFFNELAQDGILEVLIAENEYTVKKQPVSISTVEELCQLVVVTDESSRGDYQIISEMGLCLPDLLTGKSSPLHTLFPEDSSKPNLGHFYNELKPWISKTGSVLNDALVSYNHLFHSKDDKSVTFRVLEVGAGTGSGTKDYLEFLEGKEVHFEYTFTDISAAFFMNAEVKFEKYRDSMIFKKFNIEEDPMAQGFCPHYYDLIIACEVIHATKNIRQTLANLRPLLKVNGLIQITETTKPDRRITLLVGLLEGYWRFEDFDLRPFHATLSGEKWKSVLNTTGYKLATSIGCYQNVHSYIFAFAADEFVSEFEDVTTITKNIIIQQDSAAVQLENYYSWMVLCDGSSMSNEIQRRLKALNRRVVAIKKGYYTKSNFQPEEGQELIRKVLQQLEGDRFEGIIYLWGLGSPTLEPVRCVGDQEQLSLPFLHLCQSVFELHKVTCRLYVVTQGVTNSMDDSSFPCPQSATLWGITKAIRNEHPEISIHCIDVSPDELVSEQVDAIFYELWTHDGEELVAIRDGKRVVPRLASLKIPDESLTLPALCTRFQLRIPSTKSISDLEFDFLSKYSLAETEIEVEVKAAGLNFRDIFAVLKPTSQFDNINSIGSDFAGVVTAVGSQVTKWKVGDPVLGMNTEQQGLPSHVKTKENMVIRIPKHFTFPEAATIPAVFATALYSLVTVAKIRRGEVVLIHTASGGVGLSALQICTHFGATVIATAGSRRKRAYLRSLGVQHVFHSRNTDYGKQIMEVTSGNGVDVVLNSLTGPGFKEETLAVCAKNARFIEMSKLNIWSVDEVKNMRADVVYTIADLTSLKEGEWKGLMNEMLECMNDDDDSFVKPIPYTRFDALNVRQALGYLQKAKHIGKVVCIMPELKRKDIHESIRVMKTPLFNDRSTYVITGGLGGIGIEVGKWMLSNGAKHLLLVGRNSPQPDVAALIQKWNESGKQVGAWRVDVGDYDQCKKMLHRMKDSETRYWPPLRGVMHAAGVLQDATLPNQSWEKFQKTYNAKVVGSWNLHELTRDYQLEHFVMFSSVTSLFGSPGQSNHSASNAFEDALAYHRHSTGLPATTINWANWGEVGVAVDIDFPGIRPIGTIQGLRALETVLKSNRLQICVMNVDSFGMVTKLFPKVKGYVDDKRLLGDVKAPALMLNTDEFWGEVDKAEGRESKIGVFKKYIKIMLKNNLKMDEDIDDNAEFQELGVDSLMLLEMKNYMQNLFGSRLMLTASHLKDCNTAASLASRLVDILERNSNRETNNDEVKEELEQNYDVTSQVQVSSSNPVGSQCIPKRQPIIAG